VHLTERAGREQANIEGQRWKENKVMKRFLKYSAIALVVLTLVPKTRHHIVNFLRK
jgi:hypothetical protein